MYSNNSNGSCAAARSFMAPFAIMLAVGLALAASRAEAQPFAYVTNSGDNTVSVIDTATNTVEAATLAVGNGPNAVAVTPDGTHAYVANFSDNNCFGDRHGHQHGGGGDARGGE
jgi:YVTN family beta-propeller protein